MKLYKFAEIVILLALFVFTATWNLPSNQQIKRAVAYYEAHPERK